MATSRNSAFFKQENIIAGLKNQIRQEENRTWSKISERIGTAPRPTKVAEPRISFYNPNNPLNGKRK